MRHNAAVQPQGSDHPFVITAVRLDGDTVCLEAVGTQAGACCPACGAFAWEVHERYQRRPRDLSWRGWQVRLVLTARRFRCPTPQCRRHTFVEPFGEAVPRYARRTAEATA